MGILNVTPDSFYDGGRHADTDAARAHVRKMIAEGASIIDIGACSTRPGAEAPDATEEWRRMKDLIPLIKSEFPDVIISVDTFRAEVAEKAVNAGAQMVNDISGGTMDEKMFDFIASSQVPYVLMHIQGTPQTMQQNPYYSDVVSEVFEFLRQRSEMLKSRGAGTIIIDPGFGFGKSLEDNYKLAAHLGTFTQLGPVLAGFSRKSMITRLLNISKDEALTGTTALNMSALLSGASILRVHDVKEAFETVQIFKKLKGSSN
ncbi:MAG: dihydropteroate synthase [Bacteroidia bacterium]